MERIAVLHEELDATNRILRRKNRRIEALERTVEELHIALGHPVALGARTFPSLSTNNAENLRKR